MQPERRRRIQLRRRVSMRVEIDDKSGFCFGVVNAISRAEEYLRAEKGETPKAGECGENQKIHRRRSGLISLGDIVHNGAEMARLEALGLEVAPEDTDPASLAGRTVLIRAHGEPPETYAEARRHRITLIDATCPVVAQLQKTVRRAHDEMAWVGGRVVIFGRRGHAEVRGLAGQIGGDGRNADGGFGLRETDGRVVVVESEADLDTLDFTRPICLLAQTTSSLGEFRRLADEMNRRATNIKVLDTICRQVSGREEHLAAFARRFDVVIFVSGAKSSNGRVLFEAVRAANPRSHKIESAEELRPEWFRSARSAGVCGATSTPRWLMDEVAAAIRKI